MRIAIQDKFTKLPVSAARKHQLRKKEKGDCLHCAEPSVDGHRCEKHMIANALRSRLHMRERTGYKPKKKGGRGRPLKYLAK